MDRIHIKTEKIHIINWSKPDTIFLIIDPSQLNNSHPKVVSSSLDIHVHNLVKRLLTQSVFCLTNRTFINSLITNLDADRCVVPKFHRFTFFPLFHHLGYQI